MEVEELLAATPEGLAPPVTLDPAGKDISIWSGPAKLRFPHRTESGDADICLSLNPSPRFRLLFASESPVRLSAFKEPPLGEAVLETASSLGDLSVDVERVKDVWRHGEILPKAASVGEPISKAVYLIVNGPRAASMAIRRGQECFRGGAVATAPGVSFTIHQLRYTLSEDRERPYEFTHVAACDFDPPIRDVTAASDNLFRTLSLMKCRWVGVVGPWMNTENQAAALTFWSTKAVPIGGSSSWYDESAHDSFGLLLKAVFDSFADSVRREPLQTAFHWLVESNMCAGGVEGSIILQQAALECLAWLEIVQLRKLCSVNGFKGLPAADKIRWLLSLNRISAAIPTGCDAIHAYVKEYGLGDLVDVLVDVRNALVHAEPRQTTRLYSRDDGDSERTELWYQVGGVLQQTFLASIGYNGKISRRDVGAKYKWEGTLPAPWTT